MNIAKANLSTANKNLKDTVLYAPFDGIIAKKYVDNYEYVKAKQPIVSFHDVEQMDIEIQVPEYIILQVERRSSSDTTPVVLFEGINEEFPVKYKEFSSRADPDTQTYRVVFTMKAPKEINMLPGMSVTVQLKLPDYKNRAKTFTLIPSSAVFSNNKGQPQVWIVDPKTSVIRAHSVKVANMMDNSIKVLEGVKPGDEIVTAGVSFLREGQKVAPIKENK
jgi:RND family efflux transporter MFP subunit